MNDFIPSREDKFSFGLWTVGWQGVDVFGGAVRPPMAPAEAVHRLSDLGAYGITFHDNDVFPFGASAQEREQHLKPFRAGAGGDRPRGPDGHHQPVLAPGVPGRRLHQQRPRRTPVRDPEGGRQHRPRGRARCADLRRVGRSRGRRVRRRQGRPGRTRPLQGGLRPARRSTCSTGATTCASPSSRSRTSRGATSCCPTIGHALAFINELEHPEMVGVNPEVGHEEMASLNYAHGTRAGVVARQAVPHRPQRPARSALRPGPALRRRQRPRRLLDRRHRGARRLRRTPPLRLQASADRGLRRRLGLGGGVHAQLPDPAREVPRVPGRSGGPGWRSSPPEWTSSPSRHSPRARTSRPCAPRSSTRKRPVCGAWASSGSTSWPSTICTAFAADQRRHIDVRPDGFRPPGASSPGACDMPRVPQHRGRRGWARTPRRPRRT